MTEAFKKRIENKSQSNNSRLILALDISNRKTSMEKAIQILKDTSKHLSGVKIGYPSVLSFGLKIISESKETSGLPIIADFKIADVPHINRKITHSAFDAGADAVIAHAFLGGDSLQAVIEVAEEEGGGVIALPNMSHPGSKAFIGPVSMKMAKMAVEVGSDGLIGPATRTEEITELRKLVGKKPLIFSPGVGAQGGKPGDAIRSGADFEIVGRSIYNSGEPRKAAEKMRKRINEGSRK